MSHAKKKKKKKRFFQQKVLEQLDFYGGMGGGREPHPISYTLYKYKYINIKLTQNELQI